MKKLFIVTRTDGIDWDEYDSTVVLASNEKDALKVAQSLSNIFQEWNTEIERIYLTGESKVLLGSFNAG